MIHVVDGGRDEAGCYIQRIQQGFDAAPLEEVGRRLEHIGGVRRVVVSVGRVIIRLNDRQPVLKGRLVAVEGLRHFKSRHDGHAQPHQRPVRPNLLSSFKSMDGRRKGAPLTVSP